jgi:hypothetical protein
MGPIAEGGTEVIEGSGVGVNSDLVGVCVMAPGGTVGVALAGGVFVTSCVEEGAGVLVTV